LDVESQESCESVSKFFERRCGVVTNSQTTQS
jgi:hypothetical protein